MKRVSGIVLAGLLGLLGNAQATPMYYTFQGTIKSIMDRSGAVADSGLTVNDSTMYRFIVDTELDASYTTFAGDEYTYTDTSDIDYFYADLASDHHIQPTDRDLTPTRPAEFNVGNTQTSSASLFGGAYDNYVRISNSYSISDWVVGMTGFTGVESAQNWFEEYSAITSTLTLQSISVVNLQSSTDGDDGTVAVPEPSSILLLATGILGIGASRLRKKPI
ncbi:MAG: PEP-CTERM sorting domain-containing protein [Candidatus Thiodiazotropha taylori]|nr:PEP-CTERM sorting domain-containing protein [Candidatus Thiodiazotropha taylori]